MQDGKDACIITLGSRVYPSLEAAEEIQKETGKTVAVLNSRFVKPLPEAELEDLAKRFNKILFVEENAVQGGFSSAVLELWADKGLITGQKIVRLGLPDEFIEHGKQKELRAKLGINKDGIKKALGAII